MYAERDGWVCGICKDEIPRPGSAEFYESTDRDRLSLDHVQPRAADGSDYPSNIAATHSSCNKAKRDKWAGHSWNDSLNRSMNRSPPEGNGREKERNGTRVGGSCDEPAVPPREEAVELGLAALRLLKQQREAS